MNIIEQTNHQYIQMSKSAGLMSDMGAAFHSSPYRHPWGYTIGGGLASLLTGGVGGIPFALATHGDIKNQMAAAMHAAHNRGLMLGAAGAGAAGLGVGYLAGNNG